jgi:hypothetical protein
MIKGWRMYSKMKKVERPRGRQCIEKLAEIHLLEKGSKLKSKRLAGDGQVLYCVKSVDTEH